jgi:hypothetical protein
MEIVPLNVDGEMRLPQYNEAEEPGCIDQMNNWYPCDECSHKNGCAMWK